MHVITTAAGPLTPVGIEQRVEALPGVRAAAAVGVGPAGTQQLVMVVVPEQAAPRVRWPTRPWPRRSARPRRAGGGGPGVEALPVDIRHASKVDRHAAGPLGRTAAERPPGGSPVKVLVTGASGMLGAGRGARAGGARGRR